MKELENGRTNKLKNGKQTWPSASIRFQWWQQALESIWLTLVVIDYSVYGQNQSQKVSYQHKSRFGPSEKRTIHWSCCWIPIIWFASPMETLAMKVIYFISFYETCHGSIFFQLFPSFFLSIYCLVNIRLKRHIHCFIYADWLKARMIQAYTHT